MTRLSAIVPATNEPPTLDRCVAAIRAAEEPPEEVIVVSEAAAPGPAAARNEGAARATGEVLVFVDADVVARPDAFRRIRRAFESDAELAALFGSYDDEPEHPALVSAFRNLLHHHVHHAGAGSVSTFWAGLGAIRRDAFDAAGGFDAHRFPNPSVEDVDLGLRVSGAGGRIRLDPTILGTHLKAWSLAGMLHTDFARRGVPWAELMLERRAGSIGLNLAWRHRLSALAVLAACVSAAGRRRGPAAVAIAAMVALNADFYRLLLRRRGPVDAAAGVGLHALHHLTAIASIPAAIVARKLRPRAQGAR